MIEEILGKSHSIKKIKNLIEKIASTNSTVLISGETGTGKELIAKTIHSLSKRNDKPFVAINCSAIPENLIESELFGHKKGAFTGAIEHKKGLFEVASGGTFFMDEIAEMPAPLQVKLLRVIESGEIRSVGSVDYINVDVRIISATNKDLWREVEKGRFREDLFFRLNVVQIYLPPLRERKEDIPILLREFLEEYNRQYEKNIIAFSDDTLSLLLDYSYPGNIRELQNIVQHAVIFSDNNIISKMELPAHVTASRPLLTTSEEPQEIPTIEAMEKELIRRALIKYNGKYSEVAKKIRSLSCNTMAQNKKL